MRSRPLSPVGRLFAAAGVAFLVYVVARVMAAVRLRWPWWAWL
nr:hypothetical protein [Xanthomonas sp.]